MLKISSGSRIIAICALALMVSACAATVRTHGYVPLKSDLDNVIIGVDTKATLEDTIGHPTATGVLRESDWYYVESEWRRFAWKAPKEVDREVVAIRFDNNGVVENIERFGLEDGRVVVLSRRVTDSNIRGIGFIRQLLGNIGVINPEDVLAN